MKISAQLWKSRHGIYYFRQTTRKNNKQISKKVSLGTTDIRQAKSYAIEILEKINREPTAMTRFGKFEVAISQGGFSFKTDPDKPDDVENLGRFLKEHKEMIKEIAGASQVQVQQQPVPQSQNAQYSSKFSYIAEKYETRKKKELALKTVYMYKKTLDNFQHWAESKEGYNPLLMYQVDKKFISLYIEYLQANKVKNLTIENNHLGRLSTFFDFAKSLGEYPDVVAPSRGHKLKQEKNEIVEERKPFSNEDLQKIFKPENLLSVNYPDFFWLPLLAIFTGARMNELAQLSIIDITEVDGIKTFIISDENGGSVKNKSSRRKIPIHPQLIELGFLEYVEEVKKISPMLFPTLLPNKYGAYIKEPSRRFSKYLTDLGITEKSKVFHSFRHTVNNILKNNRVNEEDRSELLGHQHQHINNRVYLTAITMKYMNDNILTKLRYDDLDLSGLKYKSKMFEKSIYKRLRTIKSTLAKRS